MQSAALTCAACGFRGNIDDPWMMDDDKIGFAMRPDRWVRRFRTGDFEVVSSRAFDRRNRQECLIPASDNGAMKDRRIRWLRAVVGALVAEATQIAAAFGWVAIFSHVIQPGRPFEEYQAHAQVSGPWVSIIAGILIFYAASRWIAGSKRTAMALFGVFLLIDTALLIATWGSATHVPWLLYAVSYVSKGFACYLGGRYAEADMGPARVYPLVP